MASDKLGFEDTVELSLTLTNTGRVDGAEVVQLYARDVVSSVVRPVKELKGFKKVFLKAGESKTVTFKLPVDMLNLTDRHHQRVVEGGEFDLMIGSSSSQIHFRQRVHVVGDVKVLPEAWRMVCDVTAE